jgi:hypothetical protein
MAVEICVTWLSSLHRKGWHNAFINLYHDLLIVDRTDGQVIPNPSPAAIPTLSEWGLILLAGLRQTCPVRCVQISAHAFTLRHTQHHFCQ